MFYPCYPQQELVLVFMSEADSPQQPPPPLEDPPQQSPVPLDVPQQPPVFVGCATGMGKPWINPPFCVDLTVGLSFILNSFLEFCFTYIDGHFPKVTQFS
jgi:hypothetical protein